MEPLLRCVTKNDLTIFFEHQLDREAIHLAAFTAKDPADRAAFLARWARMLAEPSIIARTIVLDGQVAGHVMSYEEDGKPEVTYWLGREYWGQGLATRALAEFLAHENRTRPIYARAARDHAASIRVLKKCGFVVVGESQGFAHGRGAEIAECLLRLSEGGYDPATGSLPDGQ